jgi:NADPH-dependent 2,4-dienoyl-CoA reductase/sulfur reductase-like enzyme
MGDPSGTQEMPERVLHRDLFEYAQRPRTDGPYADNLDVDVLIIGAGFGGTYMLYEMRRAGFKTVLYEAGTSFGGTWRWNVYVFSSTFNTTSLRILTESSLARVLTAKSPSTS